MITKTNLTNIEKYLSGELDKITPEEQNLLTSVVPVLQAEDCSNSSQREDFVRTEGFKKEDRRTVSKRTGWKVEMLYEKMFSYFQDIDLEDFKSFFYKSYINWKIPLNNMGKRLQGELFSGSN